MMALAMASVQHGPVPYARCVGKWLPGAGMGASDVNSPAPVPEALGFHVCFLLLLHCGWECVWL